MGLPLNLFFILKELYDSALSQQGKGANPIPSKQPETENQMLPLPSQNQPKSQIKVQGEKPSSEKKQLSDIQHLLGIICSEIGNLDIIKEVFKIIHSVVTNVTKNPTEEKYRKININKILSKYQYPSIKAFFLEIHFKEFDQYLYLTIPSSDLNPILPEINAFIKANKLAESQFNPYQSSFASLANDDKKMKKIVSTEANFEDLYLQELNRRNKIIKEAKVTREPKSYKLSDTYGINNIIASMNEKDDNLTYTSEDDKIIYKTSMDLIKQNANDRFTLKSRTQFEKLVKTPIYIKSDIRLKFPDSTILEASFGLYETVGDIYNFINEYLNNKKNEYTISTTPPLKRYVKKEETIISQKLYPQILMYVNFDKGYDGLNENKIAPIKVNMEGDKEVLNDEIKLI